MADYDIKLNTNQLVDVLSKNDAIKELLESVLNGRNRQRTLFSLGRHGPFNTCDRIPMWV